MAITGFVVATLINLWCVATLAYDCLAASPAEEFLPRVVIVLLVAAMAGIVELYMASQIDSIRAQIERLFSRRARVESSRDRLEELFTREL
jgi:hypothetical protein